MYKDHHHFKCSPDADFSLAQLGSDGLSYSSTSFSETLCGKQV